MLLVAAPETTEPEQSALRYNFDGSRLVFFRSARCLALAEIVVDRVSSEPGTERHEDNLRSSLSISTVPVDTRSGPLFYILEQRHLGTWESTRRRCFRTR